MKKFLVSLFALASCSYSIKAQKQYELAGEWKTASISQVKENGERISFPGFELSNWQPAIVPGYRINHSIGEWSNTGSFYWDEQQICT